jgi:glyoxylase-like metal-dependent hydrolase (beta-lactamase superfamily II)
VPIVHDGGMPYEPITVAGIEIVPLRDAVGPMGHGTHRVLTDAFPTAAGRTVLVDTGIGGVDSPAAVWAPVPARCSASWPPPVSRRPTSTW